MGEDRRERGILEVTLGRRSLLKHLGSGWAVVLGATAVPAAVLRSALTWSDSLPLPSPTAARTWKVAPTVTPPLPVAAPTPFPPARPADGREGTTTVPVEAPEGYLLAARARADWPDSSAAASSSAPSVGATRLTSAPPHPTTRGNAPPVVAIDPGHGGGDPGAQYRTGGILLQEKTMALRVSLKAAEMLREAGYRVVLTRDADYDPGLGKGASSTAKAGLANGLQARVDIANNANADLLVSIHFNASGNSQRGTETFYNPNRTFSQDSRRLATQIQRNLLDALRGVGYQPADRGVKVDSQIASGGSLYILTGSVSRPSRMPGALGEALFLNNPTEAALVQRDDVLTALARAYATAVMRYFGGEQG